MFKVQNENLNEYLWKLKETIFENLEQHGYEIKTLYESGFRINPCPYHECGHNDCCTIKEVNEDENLALGKCFSCGNKYNFEQLIFQCYNAKNINPKKHLGNLLGIKIRYVNGKENEIDRIAEIWEITAEFCYKQLLANNNALKYENNIRSVSEQNLGKFMIGYMTKKSDLHDSLVKEGYSESEIQISKVLTIYDNLIIYPYFGKGKIDRFNTRNPFHIKKSNGEEIKGFSIGEKKFYNVPDFDYGDEVIIVEGEHDVITCYQNGIENVMATGGSLKEKQIESLRKFKNIYVFTDNDDAGRKYVQVLNEKLPEVQIFEIIYDKKYKDPDEFFRLCKNPPNIKDLKKSAIKLINKTTRNYISDNIVYIKNRNFSIEFTVKSIDTKGNYSGDFVYYAGGIPVDIKLNTRVGSLPKKYLALVFPIKNEINKFYNSDFESKSIATLLNIISLSYKKSDVIKIIADKISLLDEMKKESIIADIEKYHNKYRDKILEQLTAISNSKLDSNLNYPIMTASQAFNINRHKAYIYFNQIVKDECGVKVLPCLLSNDKRIIRLDLFKRKTEQHLLIIDGCFQLQSEIPTALMSNDICSLKTKYVNKYLNDEITKDMVKPEIIISEMESYYKKIFYAEDDVFYKILALFTYSTYFYQLFGSTGYLLLNAQKGSGKSTLSNVLSMLCCNARFTVGATEAALFRTVSLCGGTIILDEMENITSRDKTTDSLMASILKAGYTKDSGNTLRTNMETKSIEEFSVFCPKIISNIFGVDDVISDRCITLNLKKYPAEILSKLMNIEVFKNNYKENIEQTTSYASISSLCYYEELYTAFVDNNLIRGSARSSQILRPLYAIAKVCNESSHYTSALDYYYNKYLINEKKITEASSPEGYLKAAVEVIAKELTGKSCKEWLLHESLVSKNCKMIDNKTFRTNSLVIKILIDSFDVGKNYSMSEIHKIIRRVFPTLEFGKRTSVSIISDVNLMQRMKNQTKVSCYELEFLIEEGNLNDIEKNKKELF